MFFKKKTMVAKLLLELSAFPDLTSSNKAATHSHIPFCCASSVGLHRRRLSSIAAPQPYGHTPQGHRIGVVHIDPGPYGGKTAHGFKAKYICLMHISPKGIIFFQSNILIISGHNHFNHVWPDAGSARACEHRY